MTDPKLRVLISAERIQNRIRELGEKISADYPTGNLHMICILKGAIFFMTDLARAMKRDVQIDFMGISTYGKGKTSSGEVRVTKDLDISLEGADMLIVKPATPYLDVVRRVKDATGAPVAAYHVSGEYSMLKAAAQNDWIDERRAVVEILTSIRRAGADAIVTYYAKEAAPWL